MGITGLTQTHINEDKKKKRPGLNYKIPIRDMIGKRLDVDVNSVFYMYWNAIARDMCEETDVMEVTVLDYKAICARWQSSIVRTIRSWTSVGLHVKLVMDGVAPVEKAATQSDRRQSRDVYMQKATEAVKEVCTLCNVEYHDRMLHSGPLEIPLRHAQRVAELKKIHKDALKNCVDPIKENWNDLADVFLEEGFTCVRSNVEAETLCCKDVLDGEADYVLSSDSDCLAYGIPVWLRDYDTVERCFRAVKLEDVVARIGIPKDRMMDYCIACGCDYNEHITQRIDGSAVRMGPMTLAEKLSVMTLEELMQDRRIDWSILQVEKCREIFGLKIHVEAVSLRMSSDLVFT